MATEQEIKQFYSGTGKSPKIVRVGGKFSFSNLPQKAQEDVKKMLAKKDAVMARGLAGELPGLKIDGRAVTKDNIHEFEIKN